MAGLWPSSAGGSSGSGSGLSVCRVAAVGAAAEGAGDGDGGGGGGRHRARTCFSARASAVRISSDACAKSCERDESPKNASPRQHSTRGVRVEESAVADADADAVADADADAESDEVLKASTRCMCVK